MCHEALGAAAAPGQMSASAIMEERRRLFLAPKDFYLLGSPIGKSPSPDMHNAAFARVGLPWAYSLFDTEDVATFADSEADAASLAPSTSSTWGLPDWAWALCGERQRIRIPDAKRSPD